MQFNSDVWAWLYETYRRMSLKSPRYFQVVQAIGMIAALVGGIPLAVQQFEQYTGVHIDLPLPELAKSTFIKIVFWCGVITKIIAKLPVTDPHRPVDSEGEVVPKQAVMPYSVKKAETPVVPLNNSNPSA